MKDFTNLPSANDMRSTAELAKKEVDQEHQKNVQFQLQLVVEAMKKRALDQKFDVSFEELYKDSISILTEKGFVVTQQTNRGMTSGKLIYDISWKNSYLYK